MSCHVSPETVKSIFRTWRGNGGKISLHSLTKKFSLTVDEVYTILTTPYEEAIKRATKNRLFISR